MIFHYTSKEGLFGILGSKKLWLVSSLEMNDFSDRFYANLFATVALLTSKEEEDLTLKSNLSAGSIMRINAETLDVPFYTASFCESGDNDSLWQNYAAQNSGACIEIDENILDEYIERVTKEQYNPLEEDCANEKNPVERRTVQYGCPMTQFEQALKYAYEMCRFPNDIPVSDVQRKKQYEDWFYYTLILLEGVIKADTFAKEHEIRLLFKNEYVDKCVNKYGINLLRKENLKNVLSVLGLDSEVSNCGKKRMELNLEEVFDEKLIKSITIGDSFVGIGELKEKMKEYGLTKVVLKDRYGNRL